MTHLTTNNIIQVVKPVWHKAASLHHGRFNCIHNLVNRTEIVLPSAHPSPQPKWQIDQFRDFCTAHCRVSSGMPRHVLSRNNCPLAWGIWAPSNTCFLGLTRVHNPNGISVGSAAFAHITAECHYDLQWAAPSTLKLPFPWGIWTPI